ncbi:MAG: bifunctional folylpolyglutamate synthase/dihydrofolate synthase [Prevotellaceae bacterium]|nr:bifunctional folylpolyglutamate synthase/dihydrofolate synthase [Prevotellaceae bacterium]
MNYKDTIDYLFNQLPMFERQGAVGYKSGLDNTIALDAHYGHPHKSFKTIHVAGTNGKGSSSHTLAALLQANGYKVGLYTSPHLVDFRERIRVNGKCISEQYVVDFVENGRQFFEPLHPSFFELTTAMAFNYFKDQKVDIAVIEVGLGGRLDCTNIITPILSIITNISFDHTQFLGNTLSSIATEKAGIIKRGVEVVVGEYTNETRHVFESVAKENNTSIYFAEEEKEIISCKIDDNGMMNYETLNFGNIRGCLSGYCQIKNTATIISAYKRLIKNGIVKDDNNLLRKAFEKTAEMTGLKGRWQIVSKQPLTICDTGHNVAAWEYLSRQLEAVKCDRMFIVFGMVNDKDITSVAKMLPKQAIYFFTQADSHRAIKAEKVKQACIPLGLEGNAYHSVKQAYMAAKKMANDNDFIFVGGSSYVVSDFLANCF